LVGKKREKIKQSRHAKHQVVYWVTRYFKSLRLKPSEKLETPSSRLPSQSDREPQGSEGRTPDKSLPRQNGPGHLSLEIFILFFVSFKLKLKEGGRKRALTNWLRPAPIVYKIWQGCVFVPAYTEHHQSPEQRQIPRGIERLVTSPVVGGIGGIVDMQGPLEKSKPSRLSQVTDPWRPISILQLQHPPQPAFPVPNL
jgi:hypothetical protein